SVLDPGFTVFDKRVQYVTHDVTGLLSAGANTLGAVLGRGFYGITTGNAWNHEKASWHGDPRMRAQLRIDYVDGRSETVVSGESWRTHDSPTLADSLYLGETYDARKEIPGWDSPGTDLSEWQQVRAVDAPTQIVSAAENEPIKVVETHRAVEVTNPKPGVYVFRFPVTLAGWARLHVTGPKGTEVSLKYGEKLRGDGTVNHDNGLVVGDDTQVDRYILRGGSAETWEPRFSYKGFTYVEVDGYPGTPTLDALEAREVHTAVPSTGEFTSSNELVNRIHTMTRQTILNNLHGIPTDTPFFEKNGWLGDAQMTAETAIDNFGMQRVYRKWLDDIRDSQGVDGLV
ncbi:MAG TPA: family 78 glycoside hydrolase catalytic domain, partial [Coriobacteriia bacterium]|nr:family 78 glycoside hydrolase catalytic domain [Coriobacteriia bacterium]